MSNERIEVAKQAIRVALQFGLGVYSTVEEHMSDHGFMMLNTNDLIRLIAIVEDEINNPHHTETDR